MGPYTAQPMSSGCGQQSLNDSHAPVQRCPMHTHLAAVLAPPRHCPSPPRPITSTVTYCAAKASNTTDQRPGTCSKKPFGLAHTLHTGPTLVVFTLLVGVMHGTMPEPEDHVIDACELRIRLAERARAEQQQPWDGEQGLSGRHVQVVSLRMPRCKMSCCCRVRWPAQNL